VSSPVAGDNVVMMEC